MILLSTFQALQRTLEFEEEMAEKFSGGTASTHDKELGSDVEETGLGESNKQIVLDIRKKYEKKLAVQHGGDEAVCTK